MPDHLRFVIGTPQLIHTHSVICQYGGEYLVQALSPWLNYEGHSKLSGNVFLIVEDVADDALYALFVPRSSFY